MRQHMWEIAVRMISLIPFSLNVHNPVHDPQREFPDRMHDLAMGIVVQPLKCMPTMHPKAFNKLYNVRVTHIPSSVNDAEHPGRVFLFKNSLLQVTNSHHRAKVDCERVHKRGVHRQEEAGSL